MIVGQKVVCIDGNFDPCIAKFYTALPFEGQVYVIRNVVMGISAKDPKGENGCEVCLYLVGLHNPRSSKPPHPERGFNAERFRPLDEMKDEAVEDLADEVTIKARAGEPSVPAGGCDREMTFMRKQ